MEKRPMIRSRFPLNLMLTAIFLVGCAPAALTAAPAPPVMILPSATLPSSSPVPTPTPPASVTSAPTEVPVPTALPVATSRGPNLEATDPSTVNLASGGLQLVEFFRFT